jgi:ATP-dependent RNA circularization protein (DNA/RNA ligase family)
MSVIIGLTGQIGSGKTTFAKYLCDIHQFKEYSISSPLKQIGIIFGFTDTQMYGTQEQKMEINKNWGISGRTFLQKFGTDLCREALTNIIPEMNTGEHKSVWITLFDMYIESIKNTDPLARIIVSDIRFLNESNAIRKNNGHMFRITRTSTFNNNIVINHLSETEMSSIKVTRKRPI